MMAKSNKSQGGYSKPARVAIVMTAWRRCFRELPLQALFDKAREIENTTRFKKGKEFLKSVTATLKNIPIFVVKYARSLIMQGREHVEEQHQKQRYFRHQPCAAY